MSLSRIYSGPSGLGSLIIRKLGDNAGPPSFRVSDELDSIIARLNLIPRVITPSPFMNVGNVGGGLDVLHSFSLDTPNRLLTDNDWIRCTYSGLFATNSNTKRLVFAIDGQNILDTGLLDERLGVSTLVGWSAWCIYGRTAATTVAATCHLSMAQLFVDSVPVITALPSNGGFFNKYNNLAVSNLTSNAVNVTVQGESGGAASGDVDIRTAIIELRQQ